MVFKPKLYTCKLSCPLLYIDSNVLKYADNVKYLGLTLSSDQKDDNNILCQLEMLYTKPNILLRLFHHCSVDVNCKASIISQLLYLFLLPLLMDTLCTHYKKI